MLSKLVIYVCYMQIMIKISIWQYELLRINLPHYFLARLIYVHYT